MTEGTNRARRLSLPAAAGIILCLWLIYTLLFTFNPGEPLMSILGFIPGVLGIVTLRAAGLTAEECNLRLAPVSRAGLGALAAVTLLLAPILLTGRWVGADWISVLVHPLASGVSQELFFRAAFGQWR